MRLQALRGATTCDENTKDEIDRKTQTLVAEMLSRNGVEHDDLVSIIFTATDDLTAQFPATAARVLGLGDIPLLCMRELGVDGGMPSTIRVLIHLYTGRTRAELHHVYLEGARSLRDDLPEWSALSRRVALIGTGLIGGSIGLALTRAGTTVRGFDSDPDRAAGALALGALAETAGTIDEAVAGADIAIVATPVGGVADLVVAALDAGAPVVTDVGSVKGPILWAVQQARPDLASRFVGGHPMAGSEQDGLDGADVDLFAGATWVLTPTSWTDSRAHTAVRSMVADLGAEIIEVTPEHHDAIVAVVSHVPQLAATTLMDVATTTGEEQAILLRLAAGGFRDMTRIAAGDPGIWPDICIANRDAIVSALDDYLRALAVVRGLVAAGDGAGLLRVLERARASRRNLPRRATVAGALAELRVPIPDRPGVLAEITTLAGRLGVNVADIEIAHSMESEGGVLILVVGADTVERFATGVTDAGYHVTWTVLP